MISTSNKFACESCKVRADRPSTPFIFSLVPHFMTLIFPRMPHYTTTYRAAPALCHWSRWLLNILKYEKGKGLVAQTWNKASAFVYLMDERFLSELQKCLTEVTTSVLFIRLLLRLRNSSPTLMIFLYPMCWKINFTSSRPVLLCSKQRVCLERKS